MMHVTYNAHTSDVPLASHLTVYRCFMHCMIFDGVIEGRASLQSKTIWVRSTWTLTFFLPIKLMPKLLQFTIMLYEPLARSHTGKSQYC